MTAYVEEFTDPVTREVLTVEAEPEAKVALVRCVDVLASPS
jgi:hypothetical protein